MPPESPDVPNAGRRPSESKRRIFNPQWVGTYGLLLITIILVLVFTVLLPQTFATAANARAILSDQSTVAFVALAQMIPLSVTKFDLSLGYGLGLAHILAIGLQVNSGVPWPVAVLVTVVIGAGWGLANGFLVEAAQIDSFIATLGTGSILYAISFAYTGGQQIVGALPSAFVGLNSATILGIPIVAFYLIILCVILWLVYEHTPLGRYLYAVGSNPRAAELTGIKRKRLVIIAFVASGLITAIAGVVLAAKLQVGQASVGSEYLLPSFVGALLGTTAFRPGRVNVWGTVIAVVVLSVGISGLEQLGSSFFIEPLFNGVTLLIAVALAGFTARRRLRAGKLEAVRQTNSGVGGADSVPALEEDQPPARVQ
jgi:ribose transport system permease protein